ncbi:MAG: hypothetical protein R6X02_07525 [Enhygromyxa sp.]
MWKIGTPPEAVEWHPNLLQVQNPLATAPGRPDILCAGHVQLADGRVFTAGGNIDGQPATGGLFDTFIFDPVGAVSATNGPASACSFGWLGVPTDNGRLESPTRRMSHDRWYPTLTVLRDGRVLIAGGFSWIQGLERASEVDLATCQPGSLGCTCTNSPDEPCASNYRCMPDNICRSALLSTLLEVYDPVANTFDPLTGARFPINNFPVYPQMFLLPNGDVFYAGSEEAGNKAAAAGRFLTIDYDTTHIMGLEFKNRGVRGDRWLCRHVRAWQDPQDRWTATNRQWCQSGCQQPSGADRPLGPHRVRKLRLRP